MIDHVSDVISNATRAPRRGLSDVTQPASDDPAWALLVDAAWQYQWIRHAEPLTVEPRNVLYDLAQGVTDILIKLLVLAQRHAIHTGEEHLTARLLRTIADTRMQLLKPALDALRSGDTTRMAKFEDLLPPDTQIAAMMGVIDRDARVPSQLSTLRNMRRPVAASAVPSSPEVRNDPKSSDQHCERWRADSVRSTRLCRA